MSFYPMGDYEPNNEYEPLGNRNKNNRKRVLGLLRGLLGVLLIIVGGWVMISLVTPQLSQSGFVATPSAIPGLLLTAEAKQAVVTIPPLLPSPTRLAAVVGGSGGIIPTDVTPISGESQESLIVALVNQARLREGLGLVSVNILLTQTAQLHSDDQAEHETMTHTGSDGSEPWDRAERLGYQYSTFGENVLMRWDMSADGAFEQWWNSPPHHDNMMNAAFTEIGVAFTQSDEGAYFYTMVLGKPLTR